MAAYRPIKRKRNPAPKVMFRNKEISFKFTDKAMDKMLEKVEIRDGGLSIYNCALLLHAGVSHADSNLTSMDVLNMYSIDELFKLSEMIQTEFGRWLQKQGGQ